MNWFQFSFAWFLQVYLNFNSLVKEGSFLADKMQNFIESGNGRGRQGGAKRTCKVVNQLSNEILYEIRWKVHTYTIVHIVHLYILIDQNVSRLQSESNLYFIEFIIGKLAML